MDLKQMVLDLRRTMSQRELQVALKLSSSTTIARIEHGKQDSLKQINWELLKVLHRKEMRKAK